MKKALIAMSGGVDSSVVAWLMQSKGFDCAGAIMELCSPALPGFVPTTAVEDARNVAQRLGIPFYVLDHTDTFRENVVETFVRTYEDGGTPNPCIACNQKLKFGAFLEQALAMGFDYIATGHYARIEKDPDTGRYLLLRAADKAKDQSYFLYSLTQHQLSHTRFPLGTFTKEEARALAAQQGFLNARKRDSQDICFIPDGNYLSFMEKYRGIAYPAGDYLNTEGKVIGKHCGAVGYTIGQRKGLGIALGAPAYVCAKDMERNTVTLGKNEDLFHSQLLAKDWNWISISQLTAPLRVTAKVRYRHTEQPATVYPEENGYARVVFDAPQRAITAGQAVVLYDGDRVIGGGTITQV